jgi:acyl transferase domain-containing protein
VRHLVEPVRFRQMIDAMYEDGYRVFVQTGTGALATVIGDVLTGRDHLSIAANSPQRDGLEQLRRVAAALWVEGLETMSSARYRRGARRRRSRCRKAARRRSWT